MLGSVALQLPQMYDPQDVVIETVSIFGQLFANPAPIAFEDGNGDGVDELIVKFDREAFEALVPEGDDVPVTVTGEVRDTTWFTGTDSIRTIRPNVTSPNGAEYLVAGQPVDINWTPPALLPADSYTIWLSRDGGGTWEELATNVTGTSFTWTVEGTLTTAAVVHVFALDHKGVMGYDTSDTNFTIAGPTHRTPLGAWTWNGSAATWCCSGSNPRPTCNTVRPATTGSCARARRRDHGRRSPHPRWKR
jgi:hypothetical protein